MKRIAGAALALSLLCTGALGWLIYDRVTTEQKAKRRLEVAQLIGGSCLQPMAQCERDCELLPGDEKTYCLRGVRSGDVGPLSERMGLAVHDKP